MLENFVSVLSDLSFGRYARHGRILLHKCILEQDLSVLYPKLLVVQRNLISPQI